jgi:hypothetical protein
MSYVGTGGGSQTYNSLTSRRAHMFFLPFKISVTQLAMGFNSTTTPGTLKACIYDASGAKELDTTVTPTTSSTPAFATFGAVVLNPGIHFFVTGCATTCNVGGESQPNESNSNNVANSNAPTNGTVTATSGTCNSTMGTITPNTNTPVPVFRLN